MTDPSLFSSMTFDFMFDRLSDFWKAGSRVVVVRRCADGGDGVCQLMNKLMTMLFLGLPRVHQFCQLPSGRQLSTGLPLSNRKHIYIAGPPPPYPRLDIL